MKTKKYLKFWWLSVNSTTQTALSSRFSAILFLFGKALRFLMFLGFILIIMSQTKTVASFTFWQMIFFYATFNLIDTLAQFLLREVYRFRTYVVSGDFDYLLTKPISPLFRSLFGGSDILDVPLLIVSTALIMFVIPKLGAINPESIILYAVLIISAMILAISFHIFVICLGILTTEVDNTIMLYRDLTQMGRVPVDVYREPISWLITFVIPVGVMMTFPAKSVMGLLSAKMVFISIFISVISLLISIKFWHFSLRNYTSASS